MALPVRIMPLAMTLYFTAAGADADAAASAAAVFFSSSSVAAFAAASASAASFSAFASICIAAAKDFGIAHSDYSVGVTHVDVTPDTDLAAAGVKAGDTVTLGKC
jgi:hypothetical protein